MRVLIAPLGFCVDQSRVTNVIWNHAVLGRDGNLGRIPSANVVTLSHLRSGAEKVRMSFGTGASVNEMRVPEAQIMHLFATEDMHNRGETSALRSILGAARIDTESENTGDELLLLLKFAAENDYDRVEIVTDGSHVARAGDLLTATRVKMGISVNDMITSVVGADTRFSETPTIVIEGMSAADARASLPDHLQPNVVVPLFFRALRGDPEVLRAMMQDWQESAARRLPIPEGHHI